MPLGASNLVITCSTQPTETDLKLPSGFSALLATSVTTLAAEPRCAAGSLPVRVVRPGRGQARPRSLAVVSVSFRTCTLQTCSPRKRQIWANGQIHWPIPFLHLLGARARRPYRPAQRIPRRSLILVIRTERLLKNADRRLLSLMPPRAGKTRVVAHPTKSSVHRSSNRSRSPSL